MMSEVDHPYFAAARPRSSSRQMAQHDQPSAVRSWPIGPAAPSQARLCATMRASACPVPPLASSSPSASAAVSFSTSAAARSRPTPPRPRREPPPAPHHRPARPRPPRRDPARDPGRPRTLPDPAPAPLPRRPDLPRARFRRQRHTCRVNCRPPKRSRAQLCRASPE